VTDEIAHFDYEHPPEAVAQEPPGRRDGARLLHVTRHSDLGPVDRTVLDLPQLIRPGDLLVLNDTQVMPARLSGSRDTGGRVSILVLQTTGREAHVLLGTRGTCLVGEQIEVAGDLWRITQVLGQGRHVIEAVGERTPAQLLADRGRMPLPPYIERDARQDERDAMDRKRYQTVFADGGQPGRAVAAPTAGLHFTPELLAEVEARGARVGRVRLDVGEGTFRPVRSRRLDDHEMHTESYAVSGEFAAAFAETRASGGRVVAVGTTVVRTLESIVDEAGLRLEAGAGETRLFIRPGYRFRAVDALLTNFHQPRSTLLVLVSAFAGHDTVLGAYRHAVERGYRLFSYGDAMFLEDPAAAPGRPAEGA